jgi:riboflavin kinase / FMN adenylyltransferase
MNTYHGLHTFPKLDFAVVTTGTFDGVHLGHQKILLRLREIATQHQGETVLITFFPHPRLVLKSEKSDFKLLNTIEEKARLLEKYGIDHFVILPFTEEFSLMSPDEYVQKIYQQALNTQKLVIGYDHRFGKNRTGGIEFLQMHASSYGFEVEEISRQDIDEVGVSSTRIRQALQEGDVALANQYLGHLYEFSGEVAEGDKLGRTLGFPTANIEIKEDYKLIPADGIYAVWVHFQDKRYGGMLYIGNRPTIQGGLQKRIEVNIFDFDADIYGKSLRVELVEKTRDDMRLDNLDSLIARLHQDKKETADILNKSNS